MSEGLVVVLLLYHFQNMSFARKQYHAVEDYNLQHCIDLHVIGKQKVVGTLNRVMYIMDICPKQQHVNKKA
jgi:hypothetical protein